MEQKTKITLDSIRDDGSLSVLKVIYIEYNGLEITINTHREALSPGQFDRAKEILPDNLYEVIKATWTPEVITAYEEKIKNATTVLTGMKAN